MQKRSALNCERVIALKEEIDKLISNRQIRETKYLSWVAHHVLVKKPNGEPM